MNPKLHEAVAIFKELGWGDVTPENVLSLPTGTAEQKRTALAGLKSGEWGKIGQLKKNTFGWIGHTNIDESKLALFAVRVGVDARRAANILYRCDNEMLTPIIAGRGAKFASDFISYACVSRRRIWEHSASVFGNTAVRLVDKLELEIPQSVEYIKDWSVYAAIAMGLKAEEQFHETDFPCLELIEKRFVEHIHVGVAVNAPATGPFGAVLPAGVKRGFLPREEAVSLVFSALDAAVRPGDRKVWLDVLDELGVGEESLRERTQALIPLLASGDAAVITRLAPVLIGGAEDSLLTEVLVAAFSGTTKKTKQLVLKSALARPCPENVEELAPWLQILAGDKDKAIASLAVRLTQQWEMDGEALSGEGEEGKPKIQGLWRETPPLWHVPPFELGEVSPEALTELAAALVNQPAATHDVTLERFLAMANAVAYQNPEAARGSLRGLRRGESILEFAECWVKGETPRYGADKNERDGARDLLTARDYVVFRHLGELPCLLSTPSSVDLSVSAADLAERLGRYKETGTDALEADLFLAMTRLDEKTKTPETIKALQKLDIPILLQSGKKMSVTAGKAVLRYLDDPIKEPSIIVHGNGHWWASADVLNPGSLRDFPDRFGWGRRNFFYHYSLFSVFPNWGDASLDDVSWNSDFYHQKGLVLRQVARRAAPLTPGATVNFIAAQRSHTPYAAEDSMLAVTEAWERGLLRPGVANIALLDWSTAPPSNLAALAAAFDGVARDGLLSVVWPMLDALVVSSLKEPRLLAGTSELAELVAEFLPEVQSAVERGLADDTALRLPGVRALARRGGSSRAVSAAKKAVALLPPVETESDGSAEPEIDEGLAQVMDPPFDNVWPRRKKVAPLIDDGVDVTVDWSNPAFKTRPFLFTLTLPGISDRVFQVIKSDWNYDLEEGQCQAYVSSPGTTTFELHGKTRTWLHWDTKRNAMVACDFRNWREAKNSSLKGAATPLSSSLHIVIIGMLAQDGYSVYSAPRLLEKLINKGQIDENTVRKAIRTLLKFPVVSPAKLVRILEKNVNLLYALWPMLTECVKAAGAAAIAGETPPVWINRVLDIALRHYLYLAEAAKRGIIQAEDAQWAGLSEIASSKSKSTAVAKAKRLLTLLSLLK